MQPYGPRRSGDMRGKLHYVCVVKFGAFLCTSAHTYLAYYKAARLAAFCTTIICPDPMVLAYAYIWHQKRAILLHRLKLQQSG
jgi:hypothetical protein